MPDLKPIEARSQAATPQRGRWDIFGLRHARVLKAHAEHLQGDLRECLGVLRFAAQYLEYIRANDATVYDFGQPRPSDGQDPGPGCGWSPPRDLAAHVLRRMHHTPKNVSESALRAADTVPALRNQLFRLQDLLRRSIRPVIVQATDHGLIDYDLLDLIDDAAPKEAETVGNA